MIFFSLNWTTKCDDKDSYNFSSLVMVAQISKFKSTFQLRGFHHRSAIAFLFVQMRQKLDFHALLINSNRSVGCRVTPPTPCFNSNASKSFLALVRVILKEPFCSLLSPTCHKAVPYGTPRQTIQWSVGVLKYGRNGISNLLLCPSINRNGRFLSTLFYIQTI